MADALFYADRVLARIKQISYLVRRRQVEAYVQAIKVGVTKRCLSMGAFGLVRVKSRFGHSRVILHQDARRGSMNWQRRRCYLPACRQRSTIRSRREGSRRWIGCSF